MMPGLSFRLSVSRRSAINLYPTVFVTCARKTWSILVMSFTADFTRANSDVFGSLYITENLSGLPCEGSEYTYYKLFGRAPIIVYGSGGPLLRAQQQVRAA